MVLCSSAARAVLPFRAAETASLSAATSSEDTDSELALANRAELTALRNAPAIDDGFASVLTGASAPAGRGLGTGSANAMLSDDPQTKMLAAKHRLTVRIGAWSIKLEALDETYVPDGYSIDNIDKEVNLHAGPSTPTAAKRRRIAGF